MSNFIKESIEYTNGILEGLLNSCKQASEDGKVSIDFLESMVNYHRLTSRKKIEEHESQE